MPLAQVPRGSVETSRSDLCFAVRSGADVAL